MSDLVAFIGLSLSVIMIPGSNTLLVVQNTLERGARSGILTVIGGNLGILLQGLIVAFGLSLEAARSPIVVNTLKSAGGIFLIFLGVRFIWTAVQLLRTRRTLEVSEEASNRTFYEAFVAYVLTADTAIFFLTVTPQFIHTSVGDSPFLKTILFTLLYITLRFVWMGVVVAFSAQMRRWLRDLRVRSVIQIVAGAICIYLGIRLLLR
ncbi:MAG: LysE family translocator [Anaerolineae bacterium]